MQPICLGQFYLLFVAAAVNEQMLHYSIGLNLHAQLLLLLLQLKLKHAKEHRLKAEVIEFVIQCLN